jgi:hypothetical protein
MPDIDRMSLKELRGMLKEQRKTAMPPVSKMKKGAIMREVLSAEQILHKSAQQKQPEPIFGQTYGAEEITRPGAKQFARVSAKKAEGKIIGASVHEERLYDVNDAVGGQPINRRNLAKKSLAQTDEPVPATQKVVPATKKQTAKRTMQAQVNEPMDAGARDIVGEQPTMHKFMKPKGMKVGVGEVVASSVAPIQLVVNPRSSASPAMKAESVTAPVRPAPAPANLTKLVDPKVRKQKANVMERVAEIEDNVVVVKEKEKKKKAPSAYAVFVGQQRKAGYTMKEAADLWSQHKSKQ